MIEPKEAIEQLMEAGREALEAGRDEAPRIVAERSREAVESVEAGVAAALTAARERLRPEPRRPSAGRMILMGVAAAVAAAVIGIALALIVERAQRWLRQRRPGGRFDPLVREAERASDALEPDERRDDVVAGNAPVAIPVSGSDADTGIEREEESLGV
jgi:hypothetical protein